MLTFRSIKKRSVPGVIFQILLLVVNIAAAVCVIREKTAIAQYYLYIFLSSVVLGVLLQLWMLVSYAFLPFRGIYEYAYLLSSLSYGVEIAFVDETLTRILLGCSCAGSAITFINIILIAELPKGLLPWYIDGMKDPYAPDPDEVSTAKLSEKKLTCSGDIDSDSLDH